MCIAFALISPTVRGWMQNFPDWCRHLYSSCSSAKHMSKQAKIWILGGNGKFCGTRVKTCEDVAPNFGENRPGIFNFTTARLPLSFLPTIFWKIQNGCYPPPTAIPWFGTLRLLHTSKNEINAERRLFDNKVEIQAESQRVLDTLSGRDFQEAFQNWGRL
jgi:hypothetical protein